MRIRLTFLGAQMVITSRPGIQRTIAVVAIVLAGLFLGSKLNPGQVMTEDFAVYLQEADNIIHLRPLGDMGVVYVLDPHAELNQQAPLLYPPGAPLIFAPVVGIFGLNFTALKIAQLTLVLLTFVLLAALRDRLGFSLAEVCAAIGLFVVLPEMRWKINDIDSDLPFLFLLVTALLAVEAQLAAPPPRRLAASILAGIAIFLAFDVRTVGVAILPAAALAHIARARNKTPAVNILVPGATFVLLWLVQAVLLRQQADYSAVLGHKFFDFVATAKSFYWHLLGPWDHSGMEGMAKIIILVALALTALGVVDGLRSGQAAAWFCAIYLAMLLVLPDFEAGLRYLVPVLPFWGAFAARGCRLAASALRLDGAWGRSLPAIFLGVLMILMIFAPMVNPPQGALSASATQIFGFIRAHASRDALVAARKYRALHLFTGRRTIHPPATALRTADGLGRWLDANRIDFLVLKHSPSTGVADYSDCPGSPLCRGAVAGTTLVFRNSDYQVFALRR
jgi:hypothetical protein